MIHHSHYQKRGSEGIALTLLAALLTLAVAVAIGYSVGALISGIQEVFENLPELIRAGRKS